MLFCINKNCRGSCNMGYVYTWKGDLLYHDCVSVLATRCKLCGRLTAKTPNGSAVLCMHCYETYFICWYCKEVHPMDKVKHLQEYSVCFGCYSKETGDYIIYNPDVDRKDCLDIFKLCKRNVNSLKAKSNRKRKAERFRYNAWTVPARTNHYR